MEQTPFSQQPFSQTPIPRPKNWLVESILATIFCCIIFGIIGIVNAAKVNSCYDVGDYAGAQAASQQAGKWTKIAFWVGIGLWVIYILLFALGIAAGLSGY